MIKCESSSNAFRLLEKQKGKQNLQADLGRMYCRSNKWPLVLLEGQGAVRLLSLRCLLQTSPWLIDFSGGERCLKTPLWSELKNDNEPSEVWLWCQITRQAGNSGTAVKGPCLPNGLLLLALPPGLSFHGERRGTPLSQWGWDGL